MSLELCILASGSAGNAAVIRTPDGTLLIDAGIGPRTTSRRLMNTGLALHDIRAICLTHLDSDHFRATWGRAIAAYGIRVFCHETRQRELIRLACQHYSDATVQRRVRSLIHSFNGEAFEPISGLTVRSIELAHDRLGSHGFVIEGFGRRIGYASDLGRVPAKLVSRFAGLDVLALESNYDPDMQLNSARPWFLKRRIMGGRGHLSNDQAFEAVRAILDHGRRLRRPLPEHIVLLHRSRECNCPHLLRRLFERDSRIAPRLTLAEQFERSEWLRLRPAGPRIGEQLVLNW
jgi:phosphoribosyl 1,2-cyclic phosphodiesterase